MVIAVGEGVGAESAHFEEEEEEEGGAEDDDGDADALIEALDAAEGLLVAGHIHVI